MLQNYLAGRFTNPWWTSKSIEDGISPIKKELQECSTERLDALHLVFDVPMTAYNKIILTGARNAPAMFRYIIFAYYNAAILCFCIILLINCSGYALYANCWD